MSDPAEPTDRTGVGSDELEPDPCEPTVVPGAPGRIVSCGRMRTPDGRQILDTGGNSG